MELHTYQPWQQRSYRKPPDLNFDALQSTLCATDLVPIQVWKVYLRTMFDLEIGTHLSHRAFLFRTSF